MRIIKILFVSISIFLGSCTPYECDVECSIEDSVDDCECPNICYNWSSSDNGETKLYMPKYGYDIVSLGKTYTVDEGMATIQAATSAISAAYVNMYGPDSVKLGHFNAYPSNYQEIDSVQFVLDSGFVFPVEVSYYTVYSWWNPGYLKELSLCDINEKL